MFVCLSVCFSVRRVQGYSPSQTTLLCPSLVRLLYCCRPRQPGVVSAAMQATGLLWRWHPVSSGTIPTCKWDTLWTCADRWSACAKLAAASKDWIQLQPQTQTTWLYELIAKTRTLNINNFIMRMLYKNSYWHFHTPANNAYLSFILLNEYCIVLYIAYISQKRYNFITFSIYVTCGRRSILLWRQCNTLCTSDYVDDSIFSYHGANGPEEKTTRVSSSSPGGYIGDVSCSLRLQACFWNNSVKINQ